jgi:hypothetical protein
VKISKEVIVPNKRINIIEQKNLLRNIEIIGNQEVKQENCVETIKPIDSELKVELLVQNAFRAFSGTNNKTRTIIATSILKKIRTILKTKQKIKTNTKIILWVVGKLKYLYQRTKKTQKTEIFFTKHEQKIERLIINLHGLKI